MPAFVALMMNSSPLHRSTSQPPCGRNPHRLRVRVPMSCKQQRSRGTACSFAKGTDSALLLESFKSEPMINEQLSALPNFSFIVDMHMMLHDMVNDQAGLQLAPTKVSDSQGVFLRHATAGPYKSTPLRTQSLTGPAPIDWVHHTCATVPGFAYTKSSVFTADDCLTPHLELEMGVSGDGARALLYINMSPRLSLTLHPQYLEHYYTSTPPGCSSSWMGLDARAADSHGFSRYTSTSLHVRAFSASSILYYVNTDAEGCAAAKSVLHEATSIWLAFLNAGGTNSASSPAAVVAVAGQEAVPKDAAAQQQFLDELASRSAACRRFPRREAAAGKMVDAFGQAVMEDYWDSMAGDSRIRLQR